jgi:Helicase HerA, central domain
VPFQPLPKIQLDSALRLTPAISKVVIKETKGTKHVILCAEDASAVTNAIMMGKVKEQTAGGDLLNANVWLDVSRPKVALVFGRRGSGKSYDLGVMLEGLVSDDGAIKVGNNKPPVLVFDPLNQFWTLRDKPNPDDPEESKQLALVKKWGLSPGSFPKVRIFVPRGSKRRHPDAEEFSIEVSAMDSDDWCGFFGVDKYTDQIGQLLNAAYRKVTETGYRSGMVEVPAKPSHTIADLVECILHDTEINDDTIGFAIQTRRAVLARLRELQSMPIFQGSSIDLKEVYRSGQLSVFMLREVDESTRSVIVSQLVKKIVERRGSRWEAEEVAKRLQAEAAQLSPTNAKEASKKREAAARILEETKDEGVEPGWVFLDEAHVLCPDTGYSAAKEVLIEYVKQGRAMGMSLAAATQQPSALSKRLISQRDIILVHHLGIKGDVDAALSQMNPNFPDALIDGREQITTNIPMLLLNSLKRGEAICSTDEASRNFIVTMRPRVSAHGGKEPVFI